MNLNDMKKVENQNRRDIRGRLSAQSFVEDEDTPIKQQGKVMNPQNEILI
ncbi:hypothetical protein [Acetobacter sp.]